MGEIPTKLSDMILALAPGLQTDMWLYDRPEHVVVNYPEYRLCSEPIAGPKILVMVLITTTGLNYQADTA